MLIKITCEGLTLCPKMGWVHCTEQSHVPGVIFFVLVYMLHFYSKSSKHLRKILNLTPCKVICAMLNSLCNFGNPL